MELLKNNNIVRTLDFTVNFLTITRKRSVFYCSIIKKMVRHNIIIDSNLPLKKAGVLIEI